MDPLKLQCNEEGDKEKVLAENLENFQKCVERIITLILEKSNLISKDLRNVLKLCRGIVLEVTEKKEKEERKGRKKGKKEREERKGRKKMRREKEKRKKEKKRKRMKEKKKKREKRET